MLTARVIGLSLETENRRFLHAVVLFPEHVRFARGIPGLWRRLLQLSCSKRAGALGQKFHCRFVTFRSFASHGMVSHAGSSTFLWVPSRDGFFALTE